MLYQEAVLQLPTSFINSFILIIAQLPRDAIAAAVTNQKVQRFLLDHAALTSVVEKE